MIRTVIQELENSKLIASLVYHQQSSKTIIDNSRDSAKGTLDSLE